jgi:recombination protein RecT
MANEVVVKENIVNAVASRVKEFQEKGELMLPRNYIPENAMRAAWLTLQEVKDRNQRPALEVCTKVSIQSALLNMTVQALNPIKNQCYFIVRGTKLCMMPSYFGKMSVAKMVDPTIQDIYAKTVYEGDDFEYEIVKGKERVTKHVQKLQNIAKQNIIGAYATVLYKDGRELSTVMTMEQIKQSWKQSDMKPVDENGKIKEGSVHDKFTADMCERTVINKACKPIINSSSDKSIIAQYAEKSDLDLLEAEMEEKVQITHTEQIDFDEPETVEVEVVSPQKQERKVVEPPVYDPEPDNDPDDPF